MKFGVITLFPEAFSLVEDKKNSGLIGRAFEDGKAELFIEDLRDSGIGKHKVVDDSPYGGGDGMVLKPEPIKEALTKVLVKMGLGREDVKTVYTCPSGDLWTQPRAEKWVQDSDLKGIVILCGRYAGADARAVEVLFDEKVSVGPFILNGGEIPALCIIESLVRILPGVLGNKDSVLLDSFSSGLAAVEAAPYTKPQSWEEHAVPEVLLSGDHKKIEAYRKEESLKRTASWTERSLEALKSCFKPLN